VLAEVITTQKLSRLLAASALNDVSTFDAESRPGWYGIDTGEIMTQRRIWCWDGSDQ